MRSISDLYSASNGFTMFCSVSGSGRLAGMLAARSDVIWSTRSLCACVCLHFLIVSAVLVVTLLSIRAWTISPVHSVEAAAATHGSDEALRRPIRLTFN